MDSYSKADRVRLVPREGSERCYLNVGGRPLLFNGVQSWLPPHDHDYAVYMEKAKAAGFKIFTFWLPWNKIEPQRGQWSWDWIDRIVGLAQKNGLYLDIVWGGSNFCGHLDPRFAPEWVLENEAYHLQGPKGGILLANAYDMGRCRVANHGCAELLAAEQQAVIALLGRFAETDTAGNVILFQVLNEVDLPEYFPAPQSKAPSWTLQDKAQVLAYCDQLGRAVKESAYPLPTRMNLSIEVKEHDEEIARLEHIDFHGLDIYTDDVAYVRREIGSTKASILPCVAENAAYQNTSALMLETFAAGGGYNIYRLDFCHVWKKPGVYDYNWSVYPVTERIMAFNRGLDALEPLLCTAPISQMHTFNTLPPGGKSGAPSQTFRLGEITLKLTASDDPQTVALLVDADKEIYLFADGPLEVKGIESARCSAGRMDSDLTWQPETLLPAGGGSVRLTAGIACRIET